MVDAHHLDPRRDVVRGWRGGAEIVDRFPQGIERDLGGTCRPGPIGRARRRAAVAFDLDDDAACDRLAVVIDADLDHLQCGREARTLGTVLHGLDFGDDVVRGVTFDGDLHIDGPGQRGMSARPCAIDAAVVDDQNRAIEFLRRIVSAAAR